MSDTGSALGALTREDMSRRSLLKWSAVAGGTAAAVGAGWQLGLVPIGRDDAMAAATPAPSHIVWSSCNVNCGSRCPLRLEVQNGQIVRVLTDNTGNDVIGSQQIRACPRGHAIRQRIYNPDRLKYPMKRVGRRGEGKFARISWDEAYDTVASELKRIVSTYGNESVYIQYASGNSGTAASSSMMKRLMNCYGGFLNYYGSYSAAQITAASPFYWGPLLTGGIVDNNSFDQTKNSQLVVLWGCNPMEVRASGGGENYVLEQAKKAGGAKIIVVDPRYSDTAVTMADQWIPVREGSDPALIAGMAYVMITENLVDQAFLDTYTIGFDEQHMPAGAPANSSYSSYVMGQSADGIVKTPDWASKICGVPATQIIEFARQVAQAKPCAIYQGYGPQRTFIGDITTRAIWLLATMTGNIGLPGGGTGSFWGDYSIPLAPLPLTPANPVEAIISMFTWTEAIERGAEMTATADGVKGVDQLKVPIKFIWNYAGNTMINQHSQTNKTDQILADTSKCEMIVVIDNQMTPSARYADILLPDTCNAEQEDLIPQGNSGPMGYTILASQAIEPLFESKPFYEMLTAIASRLGVEQEFTLGKTQQQWVQSIVTESQALVPGLPDYDTLKQMGVWRQPMAPDHSVIALEDFRADPKANPLTTPSGKIEIYSQSLYELAQTWTLPKGSQILPIPAWYDYPEGPTDPLRKTYPLQLLGHHYKGRTHSSYANVPWLQEAHPQLAWINTADAAARGISNDDEVYVFNDRGKIKIPAKVTPRIAPGVVSVPEGAWYTPVNGVDVGMCVNTLTVQNPTPLAKGNPQHTNLVQVEKA